PVLLRWGKYVFIKPESLDRAEVFVQRYGTGGVFFARLLPVIRHLVSIPAGITRMSFGVFSVVTTVGAGVWCTILAWFGGKVTATHPDLMNDPEALVRMMKQEGHWIAIAALVLLVLYVLVMKLTSRSEAAASAPAA